MSAHAKDHDSGPAVDVVRVSAKNKKVRTIRVGRPTPQSAYIIPTLKGIMQSKRKPIDEVNLDMLGLDASHGSSFVPSTSVIGFELPAPRERARMLAEEPDEAVPELVSLLASETNVL